MLKMATNDVHLQKKFPGPEMKKSVWLPWTQKLDLELYKSLDIID